MRSREQKADFQLSSRARFRMVQHSEEIAAAARFEFGKNWRHFLTTLDEGRIQRAVHSLRSMLGVADLAGTSFLDVGSGSGLFSLAACRLGARVHSFDFDPQSVACTHELKRRFLSDDPLWTIDSGSVLDKSYLQSLGKFDVVYAWGVLHHTGAMWQAMENVLIPLAPGGRLFVAIYNYQPYRTRLNAWLKRTYVVMPKPGKGLIAASYISFQLAKGLVKDLALLRNPMSRYRNYSSQRGMSWWYDCFDWIGGYPYEAARPEEVVEFYKSRSLVLEHADWPGGHACNQFVFRKRAE